VISRPRGASNQALDDGRQAVFAVDIPRPASEVNPQTEPVKHFHVLLMCLLLMPGTGVFCGCATAGRDPAAAVQTSPVEGMNGIVKQKPSPTADMNGIEKTGYYLGWISLNLLYAFANSTPSFSP
jgi:hypothetical protein